MRVRSATPFELAGVDDISSRAFVADHGEDIRAHSPAATRPCRSCCSRTIPVRSRAAAAGVDLQLSGHTHGGQLLPLGWLARLFEPPRRRPRAVRHHLALRPARAPASWGPPLRVGTSCEITR